MTFGRCAQPSVTPMHRGRLPACSCRHHRMDGVHRPSGRTASQTIMSPLRSHPGTRTEIRLGVRAHPTRTDNRPDAPPPAQLDAEDEHEGTPPQARPPRPRMAGANSKGASGRPASAAAAASTRPSPSDPRQRARAQGASSGPHQAAGQQARPLSPARRAPPVPGCTVNMSSPSPVVPGATARSRVGDWLVLLATSRSATPSWQRPASTRTRASTRPCRRRSRFVLRGRPLKIVSVAGSSSVAVARAASANTLA